MTTPSRTLRKHVAETKIDLSMDHFLPWAGFLSFSLSNDLDDYFFPSMAISYYSRCSFCKHPTEVL